MRCDVAVVSFIDCDYTLCSVPVAAFVVAFNTPQQRNGQYYVGDSDLLS